MKIAVYCSSRADLGTKVEDSARIIGKAIADCGAELIYGGVNAGLMHVIAQAAHDAGARIIGVVPEIFRHRADPLCDELILTTDLNERKGIMIAEADVFVILPGGLGTIDEWISTLSDIMVRETIDSVADRPILVLNLDGMYDGIVWQLSETASSVYARGKRVDRSLIFANAESLAHALYELKNSMK